MVLDACQRTGTPVTLCGEMAGQPRSVLALFGMGLRRFSMKPRVRADDQGATELR